MKLLQLLCIGMLIASIQIGAAQLEDTASSSSSEPESLSHQSDSTSGSDADLTEPLLEIPDAPPLDGHTTTSSELTSLPEPEERRISRPSSPVSVEGEHTKRVSFAPMPEQASVVSHKHPLPLCRALKPYADFLTKAEYQAPAFESPDVPYDSELYRILKGQLEQKRDLLICYKNSEQAQGLTKGYDILLTRLKQNHIKRRHEDILAKKGTMKLLPRNESELFPEELPKSSNIFKWILGGATAVATVATIIWYFCYKKPAMTITR